MRKMNELKIFESKEFGSIRTVTIDGQTEYLVNGTVLDRFKLLALAVDAETEEEAWEILHVASILFHPLDDPYFNSLYTASVTEVVWSHRKNEFTYQDMFKRNYSKIGKGKVVNLKTDGHNIPDAWIRRGDYILPVEVKLNGFDDKALKQLERYMKVYKCEKGIAVGRTLNVKLPRNIEFVFLSELEGVNKQKVSGKHSCFVKKW